MNDSEGGEKNGRGINQKNIEYTFAALGLFLNITLNVMYSDDKLLKGLKSYTVVHYKIMNETLWHYQFI